MWALEVPTLACSVNVSGVPEFLLRLFLGLSKLFSHVMLTMDHDDKHFRSIRGESCYHGHMQEIEAVWPIPLHVI